MSKTIRCAVYTRKSTEEGLGQDFNSLHAQREACESYVKSQKHEGWKLIKTAYDDGGCSGGTMNRPALQLLMQDIEAETIRHIFTRYLESGGVRQLCDELEVAGIRSKPRRSMTRPGGAPFSRGALYHLLANPLYIGKIRFKGECYEGQHEGIIDQILWDKVQHRLTNARPGKVEKASRADEPLLSGKLFDGETGEALVVTHTSKNGRRYSYYISQTLKVSIKDTAQASWRLPNKTIEVIVFDIAKSMLCDREAMVNALQQGNVQTPQIPELLIKVQDVSQSHSYILDRFVTRVELHHDGIVIKLSLAPLVSDISIEENVTITRHIPMQIKRRGHEMRLVVEGGMASTATIDPTLTKAIARAYTWSEVLLSGHILSIADIASSHDVSASYVKKVLPLAFLASDIVEAIMAGKQPAHLSTHMLTRKIELPLCWHEQRQLFGFNS